MENDAGGPREKGIAAVAIGSLCGALLGLRLVLLKDLSRKTVKHVDVRLRLRVPLTPFRALHPCKASRRIVYRLRVSLNNT